MTELGRTLRRKGDMGTSRFPRDGLLGSSQYGDRPSLAQPSPRCLARQRGGIAGVNGRYQADCRWREDNNLGRGTILWYMSAILRLVVTKSLDHAPFNIG